MRRGAGSVEGSGRYCDDDFPCVCILGGILNRNRNRTKGVHNMISRYTIVLRGRVGEQLSLDFIQRQTTELLGFRGRERGSATLTADQ